MPATWKGTQMNPDSGSDLIVIGTGVAGLTAALSYLEARPAGSAPARVTLVDRAAEADRGGATRWSWANMLIDQQGVIDPEILQEVIDSDPQVDESYFRALADHGGDAVRWLTGHGVEIAYATPPFAMRTSYGATVGGGKAIVDALFGAIEGYQGVRVLYRTEAVRLHQDEQGRVDGLVVRGEDGLLRTLRAAAVVVATGGFEGSYEMLTRYVGPRANEIAPVVPGVRGNVGDGLRMITELGGATAGQFDMMHVQLVDPRSSKPDAGIFGVPYGIIVNGQGQRFVDEGARTFEGLNELLAFHVWRDQQNTSYLLVDRKAYELPGFDFLNQTDVPAVEADSIEALAAAIGVDPDSLMRTVTEFNAAVQPGELDPARLDGKHTRGLAIEKSNWAQTLSDGPFRAYPASIAITFTFGGVRTDLQARVVTPNGTPIPNLYAAGVVTGVWHREYPGAMSVLRSVVFARIAGQHAARAAG